MRDIRRYLARIGARGGRKSRRTLDAETARAMVRVREARRAFRRYRDAALPGAELVEEGLRDLAANRLTAAALAVLVGAPRLRRAGIAVPDAPAPDPEHRLYEVLAAEYASAAHSRYNALLRRLVSFERAVECAL